MFHRSLYTVTSWITHGSAVGRRGHLMKYLRGTWTYPTPLVVDTSQVAAKGWIMELHYRANSGSFLTEVEQEVHQQFGRGKGRGAITAITAIASSVELTRSTTVLQGRSMLSPPCIAAAPEVCPHGSRQDGERGHSAYACRVIPLIEIGILVSAAKCQRAIRYLSAPQITRPTRDVRSREILGSILGFLSSDCAGFDSGEFAIIILPFDRETEFQYDINGSQRWCPNTTESTNADKALDTVTYVNNTLIGGRPLGFSQTIRSTTFQRYNVTKIGGLIRAYFWKIAVLCEGVTFSPFPRRQGKTESEVIMSDTENDNDTVTHVPDLQSLDPEDVEPYQPQTPEPDSISEVQSTLESTAELAQPRDDLSLAIKGMYPLLDLITEQGSSGLVDKIVIAQQSLQGFINALSPGAYSSITKVNFKVLDNFVLKPFGIYGSKEEIVRFLCEIKAVDDDMLTPWDSAQDLLVQRNGHAAGGSEPVLRSGLYIVRSFLSTSDEQAYVVYWPEDTTLGRQCGFARPTQQSDIHEIPKQTMRPLGLFAFEGNIQGQSQWGEGDDGADTEGDDDDSDDVSTDSEKDDSDRFYHFEVAKTKDQEENVVVREGAPPPGADVDSRAFCPALLHGEKVQGFMTTTFMPERTIIEPFSHDHQTPDQIRLRIKRFPDEYGAWEKSKEDIERQFRRIGTQRRAEMYAKVEEDPDDTRSKARRHVINELLKTFPSLQREKLLPESSSADPADPDASSGDSDSESDNEENWLRDQFTIYPKLEESLWNNIYGADLGKCLKASEFQFKKRRMMFLRLLTLGPGPQNAKDSQSAKGSQDTEDSQNVKDAQDVKASEGAADSENAKSRSADLAQKDKGLDKGLVSRILGFFRSSEEELWQRARKRARLIPDSQFLSDIKAIPVGHYLHGALVDIEETAYDLLTKQVETSASAISRQFLSIQKKERETQVQLEVNIEEAAQAEIVWSKFVRQVEDISTQRSTSRTTVHIDHFEVRKGSYYSRDTYFISGRHESQQEAEIEHRIHLLQLRADERHKVQLDPSYVPTPTLEERLSHSFRVSSSTVVKYAHLLEGGRILLGLVDPQGNIAIYVENLGRVDAAIQRRSVAKLLHRDKIGETCLFALDESKHTLAVYSSTRMQLHIFALEDEHGSLRGTGSAIDLRQFYNNGESILHACFVHGHEEILFVDSSAQARIFSLTMQQPKPASLQLPQVPRAIYSSPDGSCMLVVQETDGVSAVTAYHWTTFASTDGIPIILPDFPVDLDGAFLTSITCRSIVLDITCKATEFTFQEERSKESTSRGRETAHNCLIDCHTDVWTRFPVVAAVKRQYDNIFERTAAEDADTSRKPTLDVLKGIAVSSRTFNSFADAFLSTSEWPVSRFRAGEWLADLLCLIPIHIALTLDNRFVPLKDGVLSPQLEASLLGAEVNRIVDSLSIGWYESIFQSYWASKPVKVVSSMGEQSVGKSFSLNHLLDTSFAGSAMRTTEGVWLSVSPTDDALIVALDFEGVHSLERSAQEDTLLVLFNTAISNLSFQSSSSILDPASNPSLFQSTLLVIIKDVIDSDEAEVTKEFRLKFQKIVQDEQDSNFITRLHAGKLKIIPWPVIESKEFYKLFSKVKKTLDQQLTSHHTAGEFLLRLKTLMAKLKANDWGAMSQTMAMHRANSLRAILSNALETGFSEVDPEPIPLKNFDTDTMIEVEDTEAQFILAGPDTPVADHEYRLAALRESWGGTDQRQHVDDSTWHSNLAQYLTHLVGLRVTHVESWLESNIRRFESGHASIEELRRTFGNAVIDLRASVELCRSQCGSCDLAPIYARNHASTPENEAVRRIPHTFLCAASLSYLSTEAVTYALLRFIGVASQFEAAQRKSVHMSWDVSCPTARNTKTTNVRTESALLLVNYATECAPAVTYMDWILTKTTFAEKLSRNQHPCGSLCSAGICEIQTKPQAIEATFTGRHGSFQYTEYTQAVKRLPCAKVIEPGESPGHSQQEHETSHGSMSQTRWALDESDSDDTSVELEGRKFSSNDEGGPMLCNMRISPDPDEAKDWITHALHWRRMGFKGDCGLRFHPIYFSPISLQIRILAKTRQISQSGAEHTAEKGGASAQPSGCMLPLFHAPLSTAPRGHGYVSNDGHHFACKNPGTLQASFHVIFAIDLSKSMARSDRRPLPNAAGSPLITRMANNRLGAVISSLYSFWTARQAAVSQHAQLGGHRRDAYSIIFFSRTPMICVQNDFTSTPDELLTACLRYKPYENENYTLAVEKAQAIMTSNWSTERAPVLIFLSDGESHIGDQPVSNICRAAMTYSIYARMPLSFHAVSFGPENRSAVLRRMVQIAQEVENSAPRHALTNVITSSFSRALDTVELTATFQGFANSLTKTRGSLLSSS
ncbi:hypothetical protein EDB89DRAFT_1906868 [Lactarius sanguifluus]|nr:hypothetical protein EDB89DRAFT_1906868 [Lactarius sanguifluus]